MNELRLALVGFGNVGRRFAERRRGSCGRTLRENGVAARVTGIATARHGLAVDEGGLIVLETDVMGEIGVLARGATVDQTAYGLLSDLLEVARAGPRAC